MGTVSRGRAILSTLLLLPVFAAVYVAGGFAAALVLSVIIKIPVLGHLLCRLRVFTDIAPLLAGAYLAAAVCIALAGKISGNRQTAALACKITGWAVLAINIVFVIVNITDGVSIWGNIAMGIASVFMILEGKHHNG